MPRLACLPMLLLLKGGGVRWAAVLNTAHAAALPACHNWPCNLQLQFKPLGETEQCCVQLWCGVADPPGAGCFMLPPVEQ